MPKAPTTQRTPTEAAADRVERLTSDPDLTQPTDVPADPGDTPPALSQPGGLADPTPAVYPAAPGAASAETHPRDGDRAGAGRPTSLVRDPRGRFTSTPTIPPMSADLAGALIDADAEVWKVDATLRNLGVLVFAVEFSDRVRHGGGEA